MRQGWKKGAEIKAGGQKFTVSRVKTEEDALLAAMKEIRIPEIDCRQAHIMDVVDFLQESSVKFDKKKRGINMVLKLPAMQKTEASADPFEEALVESVPGVPLVTVKLRDVSLLQAVKIVASIAGLKYRSVDGILMIVPKDAPDAPIVVRTYTVKPTVIERIAGLAGMPRRDFEKAAEWEDPKMILAELGVQWPQGSSLKYVPVIGKLVVANTADNLALFEKILRTIDVFPSQIELEVQFVAFDQAKIAKLARDQIDTANLVSLWTNGHGELIAAPKVVTKAGCEAVVKGVTEYIYPTEFTVSDPRGTNTNTTVASSEMLPIAEPSGFEMKEVGAILEVAPEISPDGAMISVSLMPDFVEEPVWEDYGGKCTGPDGKPYHVSMRQPCFHRYIASTVVSVTDGARVLVGGGTVSRDGKRVVYMFLRARRIGIDGRSLAEGGGIVP